MRHLWFAVVLLLVCGLGPARAQPQGGADAARLVVRLAGLEGVWAMDCGRRPALDNRRVRWTVPESGPVEQWVDRGAGFVLEAWVIGAERLRDGKVRLSVRTQDGWAWTGVAARVGDKLRELEVIDTIEGRSFQIIAGGRDVRTHQETPLISRCDGLLVLGVDPSGTRG